MSWLSEQTGNNEIFNKSQKTVKQTGIVRNKMIIHWMPADNPQKTSYAEAALGRPIGEQMKIQNHLMNICVPNL